MNLFRDNWPLGWTPNADESNGDIRGLLRADNLEFDEDGVIRLIRGTKKLSSGAFGNAIHALYGRIMNLNELGGAGYVDGSKVRYAVSGSDVLRNFSPATKAENIFDLGILSGGSTTENAFCYGFGHTFIFSGTQKRKDDGINQTPVGMIGNSAPAVSVNGPPTVLVSHKVSPDDLTDDNYVLWESIEGGSTFTNHADYLELSSDPITGRAQAMRGLSYAYTVDLTAFGGTTGKGTDDDIFEMGVRIGDTSKFVSVQVTFNLDTPGIVGFNNDFRDYYEYTWYGDNRPVFIEPYISEEVSWEDRTAFIENARKEFEAANFQTPGETFNFNQGINAWSTIRIKRGDFYRVGTDDSKDWSDVSGIRVTFTGTQEEQIYVFNQMRFIGGLDGPLTGKYVYKQIDVQNNGYYLEKSLPSDNSDEVNVIKSSVEVTPTQVHAEANECWTFRSGGKLNGFYRCKVQTGAYNFSPVAFDDTSSDTDLLRDNIRLDDYQNNLPDYIIGAESNFKGRNWYITKEAIYPTYRDNPSSYDSRYVIENASDNVEYNLFITKVSVDVLILATNLDFYEITGSAGVIAEGGTEFFDINIRSLGIKSPPISRNFCVREGNLFYLAADGIRRLSGSNCDLLSNSVDLLFRGETRHGIASNRLIADQSEFYYLAIAKQRLFFSTKQTDNKRGLYVYDFKTQVWRYEEHGDTDSIQALFVEEDDTIIYSTADFGDRFLRQLAVGTLFDETTDINFRLRTVYDCNGQPRNRKDSFTFKIIADSGNDTITIIIRGYTGAGPTADSNLIRTFTNTAAFNGRAEKHFAIYTDIGLVKYYQVEIHGSASVFKLYNFSVDYEPRPEQLSVLRIPPSNFGVAGRKRIPEIPLVLDTLGNSITFTPILDSIPQTTSSHGTVDKQVSVHYFLTDKTAYDVGGLLTGTLFEFYELLPPRNIETLPDASRYRLIPYSNLGSGSRKRLIQYAIVIDTRGVNVILTPIVDGINQTPQTINTSRKQTVIYTFDSFVTGIEVACILDGSDNPADTAFEFYEINLSECLSEKLPPLSSHYFIPYNNLGTASRKRFIQYAFVIDTRGNSVIFTPSVDGVNYPAQIYTSSYPKQTMIYTFASLVTGIEIGGTLQSSGDFEFYGLNLDEIVSEKLPAKAKALQIPCTNYGIAARKRIRTVPLVIDTFGSPVLFTPTVDGITYPASTLTTTRKQTALHYFTDQGPDQPGIPFGIDYCYTLIGQYDFEFYELLKPENVETLPVGKRFDQIGPIEFNKIGKIREISIRMVATGYILNFTIYSSDTGILVGSITTIPNVEKTYPISLPKGVNPNIFRMEISSADVFHRFDATIRVNIEGGQTVNKVLKLSDADSQRR